MGYFVHDEDEYWEVEIEENEVNSLKYDVEKYRRMRKEGYEEEDCKNASYIGE